MVGTFESEQIRLEINQIDGNEVSAWIHADTTVVNTAGFITTSAPLSGSIRGDSLLKLDGSFGQIGTDVEASVASPDILMLDIINLFEFGDFILQDERLTRSQP